MDIFFLAHIYDLFIMNSFLSHQFHPKFADPVCNDIISTREDAPTQRPPLLQFRLSPAGGSRVRLRRLKAETRGGSLPRGRASNLTVNAAQ